jgi:intein-encoded DNA endonuclease-like protein
MKIKLTIVGKIDIGDMPSRDHFYGKYSHFATRLKERYGLEVSKKEYIALCKGQSRLLGADSKYGVSYQKVSIYFKGTEIIAIRKKGNHTLLVTVLPRK